MQSVAPDHHSYELKALCGTQLYLEFHTFADPGCNIIDVTYSATRQQLKLLTQTSAQCSQMLSLSGINTPIYDKDTNTVMTWWQDVDGNRVDYWTGDNSHRCACGMYNYCLRES